MSRRTSCSRLVTDRGSGEGLAAWSGGGSVNVGGDEASGKARGEEGVAGGDGADGGVQVVGRCVLEQETAGSGAQCSEEVLVQVEGGEHQDTGVACGGDAAGGLDAVHVGHADVHEDNVGPVFGRCGDRLAAGAGGAHDVQVGHGRPSGGGQRRGADR
jgi:hypothetical protein